MILFSFDHLCRSLHIHQIEAKTKLNWFNHENTDTFIYCIIYPVFKIFSHNSSIWRMPEQIKKDLGTILSAAEYLLAKEFVDPYDLLHHTRKYRKQLEIGLKA